MGETLARIAAVAVWLVPGVAGADAISGPPTCPPGARGESSHAGEWCVAWPCTQDGECGPGHVCRPWRVCTRGSDVQPGGLRGRMDPPERMEMVIGTCAPADRCRGDEEPPPPIVGTLVAGAPRCREGGHCLAADPLPDLPPRPPAAATPPATSPGQDPASAGAGVTPGASPPTTGHGCGCAVPTGARSVGAGLAALLGVAAISLARRWRR